MVANVSFFPCADIIDKVVAYLAKNPDMEARLISEQGGNEKMAFLLPTSPYFAYYKQRLREEKQLLAPSADDDADKAKEEAPEPEKEKIEEPPQLEWLLETDQATIPALDFDLIRLTAQYVAKNGRGFQMGLMNRESRNPQFGFLTTHHPLHEFYQKLVENYSKIIVADEAVLSRHRKENRTKQAVIDRVMKRKAWKRSQLKTEEEERAEEEAERSAAAAIDWNEAVIVESIVFKPEEEAFLPAPIEQSKLLTVYMATKQREEDERRKREEESKNAFGAIAAASTHQVEPSAVKTQLEPQTAFDIQRRGANTPGGPRKPMEICPICRLSFPSDEIEGHIKVEMSKGGRIAMHDPKRNKPGQPEFQPVVATGEDMANRLAKMAKKRSDIFGDDDDERSVMEARRAEQAKRERESAAAIAAVSVNAAPESYNSMPPTAPTSYPNMPPTAPMTYQRPQQDLRYQMDSRPAHLDSGKRSAEDEIPEDAQVNAKKSKTTETIDLLPEKEWAEQHPEDVKITFKMEGEAASYELTLPVLTKFKAIKDELAKTCNIAANKQVLKTDALGFVKDHLSLAHYNLPSGTVINLSTKERGGRKK